MSAFDPDMASRSIAPNLSKEDRRRYVASTQEFIEDLLEDAEDSKWVYQALLECTLIEAKLGGELTEAAKQSIKQWLNKLRDIDPIRTGRWNDLEFSLLN